MKKRPGSVWWWMVRALSSLALGVATTLVVAYGGAVMDSTLDFGGYGDGQLYMLRETNRWWDVVTVMNGDDGEGRGSASVALVRGVKSWEDDSIAAVVRAGSAGGGWPQDVVMIGWPSRCLWGVKGGVEQRQCEGLIEVPEWLETIRFVHNPLPVRPWWPGMAADIALFGGGWMAVLAGPGAATRWLRRRRGGCVACGYDVKGVAVCPECGAAVGKVP